MAISVTNQDKKKARNTTVILAVLLALFALLTVIFGSLIPKGEEKRFVGANEPIKSLVEGKDGNDYFLLSDYAMYRYDSFTNELISTFELSEIEKILKEKGDFDKKLDGSLKRWEKASYVKGQNGEDFYFLIDENGNIFKLLDDGVSLKVTDDYFLVDSTTGKLKVDALDYVDGTLYCLLAESDNNYYIYRFNVNDLKSGLERKKQLWDIDLKESTPTTKKIIPLSSTPQAWSFETTKDGIYLFKNGGGIIRINPSFADFVDENGNEYEYLNEVKEYYEEGGYKIIEENAYADYFRNLLLNHKKNTHTPEEIASASKDQLVKWFNEIASYDFTKENKNAKDAAKEAIGGGFTKLNPWCEKYDSAQGNLLVKESFIDSRFYSVLSPGNCNISGIVYSEKNEAMYYANVLDGRLYSVEKSALDGLDSGALLSDIATEMSSVDFGTKKKFSTFGNGLGINKFSNTLYILFQNEQTVSLVDINDKKNYKILYTFEANFDINTLTGDKDNKVTNVVRQVSVVDLKANKDTLLYLCSYEPEKMLKKELTSFLFVAFLVVSAVLLFFTIWFLLATKRENTLYRLKVIQKDVKKNKKVYLALSFFVILLFMFCYYEAIGAISMSFFDYTQKKPAWIWNNFANYITILNDLDFWHSIGNMLFFLVFDLLLCIAPPLIFAFLLILIRNKTASGLIRSLMFIPSIIPSMATMLIWRTGIYGDTGVLNQILGSSVPIDFLGNTNYARWALMFMGFPFVGGYLIFYGGMMNIPGEYHEAGRLEGLSTFKRFFLIDIPLIMPQIKYIFIMTFISSVQNYARTYILASTGTTTPVETMYTTMMIHGDYGMASAYATLIFIFLFVAVAANFKMQKKETMGEDL